MPWEAQGDLRLSQWHHPERSLSPGSRRKGTWLGQQGTLGGKTVPGFGWFVLHTDGQVAPKPSALCGRETGRKEGPRSNHRALGECDFYFVSLSLSLCDLRVT